MKQNFGPEVKLLLLQEVEALVGKFVARRETETSLELGQPRRRPGLEPATLRGETLALPSHSLL